MKPSSKAPASFVSAPAAPPVTLAPADHFFVRRLDLPAGMAPGEVAGFVALQLEELSPFPVDQLYSGHVRATDGSAVLVYAAYRRRFPAGQTEAWRRAMFVLPEFLPALRLRFARDTVVYLRTDRSLSALVFGADKDLPLQVVSRPLAADSTSDRVEAVRRQLLAQTGADQRYEVAYRLRSAPDLRGKSIDWALEPDGPGQRAEISLPMAECWSMDIRDPEFIAQQRKRLGFDVILWRIVQGAAAALVLMALGEAALVGAGLAGSYFSSEVERRRPEVVSLEDRNSVAIRLAEFGRSGVRPFDMFVVVASRKPESVTVNNARADGVTRLELDATAPTVAVINSFEAAMREKPEVADVSVRDQRTRPEGTTFKMLLEFKPDAFGAANPAVAAAVADR